MLLLSKRLLLPVTVALAMAAATAAFACGTNESCNNPPPCSTVDC